MTDKKQPPSGASQETRDCYGDCDNAYDACMSKAGSDAEKLACKAAYTKCLSSC